MAQLFRKAALWLLLFVVGGILTALAAEWFIEVARDKGLFADAGERWDSGMSAFTSFLVSGWVLYPVWVLGGFVAGLWIDKWLRAYDAGHPSLAEGQAESDQENHAPPAITMSPDDTSQHETERYRHLIQSWFRMVDEIEQQYATAGHAPNHEIRRAILRRSEYHQLEPHLAEDTRLNIQQPSGISIGPAVTIAGEETDTEQLLRTIRSDIAAIERDWGIAPAKRGRPATPAPPSP